MVVPMADRPSFGRRGDVETRTQARPAHPAPLPRVAAPPEPPPILTRAERDEELEAWKRGRKRHIPWKQISLMASLCFGIGSLVLPHDVNQAVQWPLYGLAAISFYVGIRTRKP